MQSLSLALKDRTLHHLGRAVAVAALFAVLCGAASAQTTAFAKIFVVPAGTSPLPVDATGKCEPKGRFLICVQPDPIETPRVASGSDVAVQWNLSSRGWSFVGNRGIDIKNKKNWSNPKEDSPTQYTAKNKKEDGAQIYKYEIRVTDGTTELDWDPTIRN